MNVRRFATTIALTAAALAAGAGIATADEEFPRNGIIPPGTYDVTRHPANVIGSPLQGCTLIVYPGTAAVDLNCPGFSRSARQLPIGPDETHIVADGLFLGLDLRDIDPRQGHWIGTINVANTPIDVPYPLAGMTLQRR